MDEMLNVMIVDDEQIVRVYLKSLLQERNDEFNVVSVCKNGEEAKKSLSIHKVDVVLTDLKMPKCTGITLIQYMNQFYANTPVIVLSNHGDYDLVRESLKLGVEDYFLKVSLTPQQLFETLEQVKRKLEVHQLEVHQLKLKEEKKKLAKQAFLASLLTEENMYTREELEIYVNDYRLFESYLCVLVFECERIDHFIYFQSMAQEIFKAYRADVFVGKGAIRYVVLNCAIDPSTLTQLVQRFEKEVLICLNDVVRLLSTIKVSNLEALLPFVTLKERVRSEVQSDSQALISNKELASYRQEIQQIIQYIHEFYRDKITLQSLADLVVLNEAYLSRLFKRETGRTINHYLNEVRIYHAKSLLRHEEMMIKEIAQSVGIKDQLYFNRVFRKYYGMSPSDYREHVKKAHS